MSKQIMISDGSICLVDDADYERLSKFNWYLHQGYARTNYALGEGKYKGVLMHRMIFSTAGTLGIDHANRNKLDNRRNNLRLATPSQNSANAKKRKGRSIYRGVEKVERLKQKPWKSIITHDGLHHHLGYFATEIEAAKAWDIAALKYHGEFASLNFPLDTGVAHLPQ
jgi:hypothetical protein